MVLPEAIFIKSTMLKDLPPSFTLNDAIITAQTINFALLDPLIQPHNLSHLDNLWWKGDALVVVGDNNLKKGVLHFYHDTPVAGHPGILNTFSLLKHDYWWPNMKQLITDYVKECAQCQANKTNTHKIRPPLYSIKPQNAYPFETIALNFITKLPESRGFDTILTITDHDCSKAALFIPCREEIDGLGVAQLHLKHVFPHYDLPRKVISNQDPRFASHFSRELCKQFNIKQNISSTYHPQTNEQSEHTNQKLEQYLHFWCFTQQDDWADWLSFAQFALNS